MGAMTTKQHAVVLNDYKATTEGVPTHIVRTFEELGSSRETAEGEEDMPANPSMPAAGLKIDISIDEEGDQKVTVLEGEAPENDKFMESQTMTLGLDALLPTEAVEVDATWELDSESIQSALGVLMPQPGPRPEGSGRRRGGDDRFPQDGPPQGRRGMRGGSNMGSFFAEVEWSGEAKLASLETEYEGVKCAVIELTMEAAGDLPERNFGGGGRDRGDRSVNPLISAQPVEGEAEVKLTGKLYFSLEGKHPMALAIEGTIKSSNSVIRDRGERTMSMYSEQEGEIQVTYTLSHEERTEVEESPSK
jgi:hypothetical protein